MADFTLAGFVEHLAVLAVELVHAEHTALEEAALLIENEAKAAIGEYQQAAGPFDAWAELADSTKADRLEQGYPENEPELRTGELRDSIEHTVHGREADIGSDSEILEYQELGTSKMPARSILGGAAVRKEAEVVELIGEGVNAALIGGSVTNGLLRLR
jgi:HK97 gp10 family phage protein